MRDGVRLAVSLLVIAMVAALVVLLGGGPEEPPVRGADPASSPSASSEAAPQDALGEPVRPESASAEEQREEVAAPSPALDDTPAELAIHGQVLSVGLLTEEILVRLVLFDVPTPMLEDFDAQDLLSWWDGGWVRQSKPRPIEADGSFVLQGTPPPARPGTVRRYAACITMEVGGNGFPIAEGQTVLPIAISPALLGDEHPAENPLQLEAARPYRLRFTPDVASEMLWAVQGIEVNLSVEPAPHVDEEDDLVLPDAWLEIPPPPPGQTSWVTWVSRLTPGYVAESAFIDDWLHWDIELDDPVPIDQDREFRVTCDQVGHLTARLPRALIPEGEDPGEWLLDQESVQFRVIPDNPETFAPGWQTVYSTDWLFEETPELDPNLPTDRLRIAGLHTSYDPPSTWIPAGWFEPGLWSLEVLTPDGERWVSDPVQVRVGSSEVVSLRLAESLQQVTIVPEPDLRALVLQDATLLDATGTAMSIDLELPYYEDDPDAVWKIRLPQDARQLRAWAIDPETKEISILHASFPAGNAPREVPLLRRATRCMIELPDRVRAYSPILISAGHQKQFMGGHPISVYMMEELREGLTVRGLALGPYTAWVLTDTEPSGTATIEFTVR